MNAARHKLWFVAHRVADETCRAACYVCGWWSDPTLDAEEARATLIYHVNTEDHRRLWNGLTKSRTGKG